VLPVWAEILLVLSAVAAAAAAFRLAGRVRSLEELLRVRERGTHFLAESPERREIVRHAFAAAAEILPIVRFDLYTLDSAGRVEEVWTLPDGKPSGLSPVRRTDHEALGTRVDRQRLLDLTATETERSFAPKALLDGGPRTRRLQLPLYSGDRLLAHLDLASTDAVSDRHRAELRALMGPLTSSLHASRNWEIAVTDELTGLSSRRYFETRLAEEWARRQRSGSALAVACFDLDRFKSVNDTYGHPAGDQVLRVFGEVARRAVRAADVPCRYGGEEFAVLFPESGADAARTVAQRIRKALAAREIQADGHAFRVTVSVGVADTDGLAPDDKRVLVHRADRALYKAKEQGRNRVVVWKA
jgi:diguanylate cyclase (GGDEF)-like protein